MTMQCMICNDDDEDDENGGDYDGDTMMVISIMMKTMTNPYFALRNDGSVHEFTPGFKDFNLKLLSDDIYKRT